MDKLTENNAVNWSKQEHECLKCKRTKQGCRICSIYKIYKVENCQMFKHVLRKFALYENTLEIKEGVQK